uniref:Uncharacterized protein n=1 Tax=Seriola dumerili TaxID=41447 RepID=A0A3B4TYH8_SERDU
EQSMKLQNTFRSPFLEGWICFAIFKKSASLSPEMELPGSNLTDVCSLDLPPVGKQILDLAQKMSEDIVAQALQLCWEVEIRYKDLPFIDNECDYVI